MKDKKNSGLTALVLIGAFFLFVIGVSVRTFYVYYGNKSRKSVIFHSLSIVPELLHHKKRIYVANFMEHARIIITFGRFFGGLKTAKSSITIF